jgi:hypothetical protein
MADTDKAFRAVTLAALGFTMTFAVDSVAALALQDPKLSFSEKLSLLNELSKDGQVVGKSKASVGTNSNVIAQHANQTFNSFSNAGKPPV